MEAESIPVQKSSGSFSDDVHQFFKGVVPKDPKKRLVVAVSIISTLFLIIGLSVLLSVKCKNTSRDGSSTSSPSSTKAGDEISPETSQKIFNDLLTKLRQESPNLEELKEELNSFPTLIQPLILECSTVNELNENVKGPIISLLISCLPILTEPAEPDDALFQVLVKPNESQNITISPQVSEFWFDSKAELIENLNSYLVANNEPNLLVFISLLSPLKENKSLLPPTTSITSTCLFHFLGNLVSTKQISQSNIFSGLLEIDWAIPEELTGIFPESMLRTLQPSEFCKTVLDLSFRFMFAYQSILTNLTDDDKILLLEFIFDKNPNPLTCAKRFIVFNSIISDSLSRNQKNVIYNWSKNEEIANLFTRYDLSSFFTKIVEGDIDKLATLLNECSNVENFLRHLRTHYASTDLFPKIMAQKPKELTFVQLVLILNKQDKCLSTVDNYLETQKIYETLFPIDFTDKEIDNLAERFTSKAMPKLKSYAIQKLITADLTEINSKPIWKIILEDFDSLKILQNTKSVWKFAPKRNIVTKIYRNYIDMVFEQMLVVFPNPFSICKMSLAIELIPLYFAKCVNLDISEAWNSLVEKKLINNVNVNSLIKQTKLLSNLKLIFKDSSLYGDEKQEQMVHDLLNCYIRNNGNIHEFLEFFRNSVLDKFKMSDKDFKEFLELSKQNPPSSKPTLISDSTNSSKNSSKKAPLSSSDSSPTKLADFGITGSNSSLPIDSLPVDPFFLSSMKKRFEENLDKFSEVEILKKLKEIYPNSVDLFLELSQKSIPKLSFDNLQKLLEFINESTKSSVPASTLWNPFYFACLMRYKTEPSEYLKLLDSLSSSGDRDESVFKFIFYSIPLDKIEFVFDQPKFQNFLTNLFQYTDRIYFRKGVFDLVCEYLKKNGATISYKDYKALMKKLFLAKSLFNGSKPIEGLSKIFQNVYFVFWMENLIIPKDGTVVNLKHASDFDSSTTDIFSLKKYFVNAIKSLDITKLPNNTRLQYLKLALKSFPAKNTDGISATDAIADYKEVPTLYDAQFLKEPLLEKFINGLICGQADARITEILQMYSKELDNLTIARQIEVFSLSAKRNPEHFKILFPTQIPDALINEKAFQETLHNLLLKVDTGIHDFGPHEPCAHLKMLVEKLIKDIEDVRDSGNFSTVIIPDTIANYLETYLIGTIYQSHCSVSSKYSHTLGVISDKVGNLFGKKTPAPVAPTP